MVFGKSPEKGLGYAPDFLNIIANVSTKYGFIKPLIGYFSVIYVRTVS